MRHLARVFPGDFDKMKSKRKKTGILLAAFLSAAACLSAGGRTACAASDSASQNADESQSGGGTTAADSASQSTDESQSGGETTSADSSAAAADWSSLPETRAGVDQLISYIPEDWPEAPELASESAIVVEITSGTILMAKNATQSMYPASTTKLMTAYLTLENCGMDEVVEFSRTAITSLTPGSSHIGLKTGDRLTVEQCLYGLLLPSANDAANGLAEHISGSISAFADLMNETAAELGCVNTTFTNANGLHDPNHTTCAYDLYRIMLADIGLPDFVRIASTTAYVKEPDDINQNQIPMQNTNLLIREDSEFYNPIVICSKTGWTDESGRCLVTYAKTDGMELIVVVMNSEYPGQYTDTNTLLDWAVSNFSTETPSADISGSADPQTISTPLGIPADRTELTRSDASARIVLPAGVTDEDLTRTISADGNGNRVLTYLYEGYPIGSAAFIDGIDTNAYGMYAEDSGQTLTSQVKTGSLHAVSIRLLAAACVLIAAAVIFLILLVRTLRAPKQAPEHHDHKLRYF